VRDEALRNKATPPAESAAPPQAAALQEVSSPAAGAETPAATTAAAIDTAAPPAPNASNVGGLKPLGSVSGIPSNFVEDQPEPDPDWDKEAYPFSEQDTEDQSELAKKRVHKKVMKISGTKISGTGTNTGDGDKAEPDDSPNKRTGTAADFTPQKVKETTVLVAQLKDGEPLTMGKDLGKVGGKEIDTEQIRKFVIDADTKGANGTSSGIQNAVDSGRPGNQNFGKGDIAFQEMVIDTRALATATDQIQKELGKHQAAITDVDTQFKEMQKEYQKAIGKVATGMKEVAEAEFAPEKYNDFTEAQYKPQPVWPPAVHQKFPSYDIVVPEER